MDLALNIHRKTILFSHPLLAFSCIKNTILTQATTLFLKESKTVRLQFEQKFACRWFPENRCPVFIFTENSPSPSKHVQNFPQAWLLNISPSTYSSSSSSPVNLNSTFDVLTYCCSWEKRCLKVFQTNLDLFIIDQHCPTHSPHETCGEYPFNVENGSAS